MIQKIPPDLQPNGCSISFFVCTFCSLAESFQLLLCLRKSKLHFIFKGTDDSMVVKTHNTKQYIQIQEGHQQVK